MKRIFFLNHAPIEVLFTKNANDFVVNEIPLYEFSGEGEHLVLHVRKKDLTTWQMVQTLSEFCGAKVRDFGYAGLKDKDGMTTQYISIHKSYEAKLEGFEHEKIKILSKTYHNNKIKIGHLRQNRFFIRLKRVHKVDGQKLSNALKILQHEGYPNFFGYQRFGREGNNYLLGRDILSEAKRERNRKKRDLFISAYQSYLFNTWLNKRLEIGHILTDFDDKEASSALGFDKDLIKELRAQPHFLKILDGDVLHHYPAGKPFVCTDTKEEAQRFARHEITLTGWLVGNRSMRSEGFSKSMEDEIYAQAEPFLSQMDGGRRFAWSFLEDVEFHYKEDEKWFEMHFSLQKGSYATTVLEELLHMVLEA
ncbi:MAG TPA: tRNA pseudouridine(13) synthase TruD [Sulfurospirillum sp. UBA12182]|nr:MAG TPA: tRNA pseudouridine(13) synthase TruD [Sulfurospirillum sp. UBA12182]